MLFDTSLGNMSYLPPEIRLQIWDHLSLYPIQRAETDPVSPTSRQPRLAFLQISNRIYDEASRHIYKDVVLRFQVFPEYQYRSWLTVESNAGTKWHLQDLDDAVSRGFGKLPYEKLKGIRVEIHAPHRRDPGQVVCLWKKCLDLARLLEQANHGLPNVEIHLKDSTWAKWSVDGKPQKSLAVDCINGEDNDEDYEIVLTAFYRLRNVQTAKVYLPEDMVYNNYTYNIGIVLEQEEAFGTSLDADDPWNDKILQKDQDQMFMDLDVELDLLPGNTANMMRLERFSSWYTDGLDSESKYERELERILKTRSALYYNDNIPHYIQIRHAAMRTFYPRSLYHQCQASKSGDTTIRSLYAPTRVRTIQEAFDLGLSSEEWDRDTWHNGCYPRGIPPFDSDEFLVKLWTDGIDGSMSMTYEKEFIDKLMGWVSDDDRQ